MSRSVIDFTVRSSIEDTHYLYGRRPGDDRSSQWTLATIKTAIQSTLTIAQSNVTNLVSDLAGKASLNHGHTMAQVSGLNLALDAKASLVHTHTVSEIVDFSSGIVNHSNNTSELVDDNGGIVVYAYSNATEENEFGSLYLTTDVLKPDPSSFSGPSAELLWRNSICDSIGALYLPSVSTGTKFLRDDGQWVTLNQP